MRRGPGSALYLEPAPHEAQGNLIFTEHGLAPYEALHELFRGESSEKVLKGEGRLAGERWLVELETTARSGLAPRADPSFSYDRVFEFKLSVTPKGATGEEVDERKATYLISPRWPGLESLGDSPAPSVPPGLVGVNVSFSGSNLEFDTYPILLRRGLESVGVSARHFGEDAIHRYSNIQQYELYVRALRRRASALIGRGGTLEKVHELVGREAGGYQQFKQDDRPVEGYDHQLTIDSAGAEALIEGHVLGKRITHYQPKHVRTDPSDPLYHPKLCVALVKGVTDGRDVEWLSNGGSVRWHDRDKLEHELEETLLNLLSFSDLPTRADRSVYVPDAHFEVTESERELTVIEDPLPGIRRTQREAVVHGLWANSDVTQTDEDMLEVVADGGTMQVDEVATEVDCSPRTVRRSARERLSDVFRLDRGVVGFVSKYVHDKVSDQLADRRTATAEDGDGESEVSAWDRFLEKYAVDVDDRADDRLTLRIGTLRDEERVDVQREGLLAWIADGRGPGRYKDALFEITENGREFINGYLR